MAKRIGKRTLCFDKPPVILGHAAVVGKKENEGPLAGSFDAVAMDAQLGEKSWEAAESALQRQAIDYACKKAGQKLGELDLILAGDLLNQCIASAYASSDSNVPYLGLYGACSTMAEGLALGAALVDGGGAKQLLAAASSHFCAAERQFRLPLEYGSQRPPTAQWTATAAGAAVLGAAGSGVRVTHAVFGQMVDMGVNDANDMGAAMAPAAYDTLSALLRDTNTTPADYDGIFTGDLARVGSNLLRELFARDGVSLTDAYTDCGSMLYSPEQDTHAGGSGCGCSAAVLCGQLLRDMERGRLRRIIFAGTGAMMSPTSIQQGQSIIGVCHAVVLEGGGA